MPQLAERIRAVHDADNTFGAPRITAELNDGAPAEGAGQPQAGRAGDARARHRRLPTPPQGPHHDPRTRRSEGPRPAQPGLHRPGAEPALRRRHHLPAACRRGEPVPGHGDRLLLPPTGRLGDRRPHAHRTGRRRPQRRPGDPRAAWPGRSSTATTARSTPRADYARLCADLGVTQSMGAVGTSADNASPSRSTRPSNARSSKTSPAGPTRPPAAARSSGGSSATTPAAGTPGAATSPRSPTKPLPPLRSRQRRNPTPCPRTGGKAPGPFPRPRPGPFQPVQPGRLDPIQHPPCRRGRGHRPEQVRLVPQHRQIRDRLTAISQQHREIGRAPNQAHAPDALPTVRPRPRRTPAATLPPPPHRPAAGTRHATPHRSRRR